MPDKIVPEPTPERHLTLEQKRRIIAKYVERHRKLPYPDLVPVPEFKTGGGPNVAERVWLNKWNIVRHFIVDGGGAAIAAFTATKDLTVTGAAFLVGGVVGAARKGIDDERRAAGKQDILTSVLRPNMKGAVAMGIRDEVVQFQGELRDLIMIFFDEKADKTQVMEIASAAWDAFNEAKDLKGLSKDDMVKAGIDTTLSVAASLKDEFIKYSDEVAPA